MRLDKRSEYAGTDHLDAMRYGHQQIEFLELLRQPRHHEEC
ncbi:hypothetical protein SMCF_5546, partial [Streptomyces coelicoflavus ZG0656]